MNDSNGNAARTSAAWTAPGLLKQLPVGWLAAAFLSSTCPCLVTSTAAPLQRTLMTAEAAVMAAVLVSQLEARPSARQVSSGDGRCAAHLGTSSASNGGQLAGGGGFMKQRTHPQQCGCRSPMVQPCAAVAQMADAVISGVLLRAPWQACAVVKTRRIVVLSRTAYLTTMLAACGEAQRSRQFRSKRLSALLSRRNWHSFASCSAGRTFLRASQKACSCRDCVSEVRSVQHSKWRSLLRA
jgi:hypothetical protein